MTNQQSAKGVSGEPVGSCSVSVHETLAGAALPRTFDAKGWDGFVASSTGGTAYHRSAWLEAVSAELRHRVFLLEARDSGRRLVGVLPLVLVASRLFGRYLVGVPFASYGGPLGSPDAVEALCATAVSLAQKLDVGLLELRARMPLDSPPAQLTVSTRKLTVTLPLEGGAGPTFSRFSSKLRSQVRRGEKAGLEVTVAPRQAADFYGVFAEHMRDLGSPALSFDFFSGLVSRFGDDFLFSVARLNGHPVAAGAGFRYGTEFEISWAAALRKYSSISPNMLMYWRLMAHLADAGVQTFNFGRCSPDSGTHRFKRQWGGVDETLHWYQWSPSRALAATPAPGGRFSLAQTVWMRLPLPLTRALGPGLSRLLP